MAVTVCKSLRFPKLLIAIAEKNISVVFALLLVPRPAAHSRLVPEMH